MILVPVVAWAQNFCVIAANGLVVHLGVLAASALSPSVSAAPPALDTFGTVSARRFSSGGSRYRGAGGGWLAARTVEGK